MNFDHLGIALGDRPRLTAYLERILARPSFATMIAKEKAFMAKIAA